MKKISPVLILFVFASMSTSMLWAPNSLRRRFSSTGGSQSDDPATTAMHATAASSASAAAAGSATQAAADAAHAHGDAGSAAACALTAQQAAQDAAAAQRIANQAAQDAATNTRHIRNITPLIILIGAYCFYTSMILAPQMKRHYSMISTHVVRRLRKVRRAYRKKLAAKSHLA